MSTAETKPWQGPEAWGTRPMCVVGGGVLGRRIAACFVAAGLEVRIRDPSTEAREQSARYIRDNLDAFTSLTQTACDNGRFQVEQDMIAAVADCWLVVEAVPEVLSLKESTFAELEEHAPADCILATNSSSYKSGQMLAKLRHDRTKTRVCNMHFMMPPEALIVELMTCGATAEHIFPFLSDRLREAGLHPVTALKESTGFIFNRIWAAVKREVLSVLAEEVSTPDMIDAIWIEQYASRKVGPCSMMDSIGLDTVEHIEEHYVQERKLPRHHLDFLRQRYISRGMLGNKTPKSGGLYPPPAPRSQTRMLLLNVGLAEPLKDHSLEDMRHSGEILHLTAEDAGARPTRLVGGLAAPDGIDVAASTKRMYWTNMGHAKHNDGSIQSANLDGSDVRYVIRPGSGLHTPKQMVIDQQSNRVYCCDREGLQIVRLDLDGDNFQVIYRSGDWKTEPHKQQDASLWPVGIALSPKDNKMFWTQKGPSKANQGRILAAKLEPAPTDPAHRDDIETVIQELPECVDLEFDDDQGILYWTDRGELPLGNTLNRKQVIMSSNNSSSSRQQEAPLGREILAQGLGEAIGLRLDKRNNCVYVADLGGRLWKCSVDGGPKEKIFEGAAHAYTGVAIYKE